jgi:hypothetical protein
VGESQWEQDREEKIFFHFDGGAQGIGLRRKPTA